ncbi:MAG: hypothetical protein NUV81_03580 [bacterium]|nr:hypothetical protein [bacterium]
MTPHLQNKGETVPVQSRDQEMPAELRSRLQRLREDSITQARWLKAELPAEEKRLRNESILCLSEPPCTVHGNDHDGESPTCSGCIIYTKDIAGRIEKRCIHTSSIWSLDHNRTWDAYLEALQLLETSGIDEDTRLRWMYDIFRINIRVSVLARFGGILIGVEREEFGNENAGNVIFPSRRLLASESFEAGFQATVRGQTCLDPDVTLGAWAMYQSRTTPTAIFTCMIQGIAPHGRSRECSNVVGGKFVWVSEASFKVAVIDGVTLPLLRELHRNDIRVSEATVVAPYAVEAFRTFTA